MSNIPVGHEPWVGIRVFFDEVGNSFNDPAQQVFAFSALVFASEQHKQSILKNAAELRLIGPEARRARSRTEREERIVEDVLSLLGGNKGSLLDESKVIVSISYVDLKAPRVRDLLDHGKQSIIYQGVAYLTPELAGVSGKNWLWVHTALMALTNALCRVVGKYGQFVAELHAIYDERRLDKVTAQLFKNVVAKRFVGNSCLEGLKDRFTEDQWEALQRRVDISQLNVTTDSDESEGALRLAHWVARIASRGLNPADPSPRKDWIARIVQDHGCHALRDVTNLVV